MALKIDLTNGEAELTNYNVIIEYKDGHPNVLMATGLTRKRAKYIAAKKRNHMTKDEKKSGMKYLSVRDDRVKKFIKNE